MISGDCAEIGILIPDLLNIMDKKYNGYRMSAADAQRVAHQIAFAPIVFQVSRLMIKYGIFAMLEEALAAQPKVGAIGHVGRSGPKKSCWPYHR